MTPKQCNNAEIIRFEEVVSTNLIALDMGQKGAAQGTVVLANCQSQGRGRLKKTFSSPPGGLYISIILRPQLEPEQLPFTTLAAGVATCKTVEAVTGIDVMLKWPNDLYIGRRKLAGILTESAPFSGSEQTVPFVVVGIGLNVSTELEMLPPSLQDSVTSLYCHQHIRYEPERFVPGITELLVRYVDNLADEKESIFNFWQERDYLYGKSIRWVNPAGVKLSGRGSGIHHDGSYKLTASDGSVHLIIGGELQLASHR